MSVIKNLGNFPCRLYQERWNWCIPASIEAVTKYHEPRSQITQGYLFTKIMSAGENKLGLADIKGIFQNDQHFSSWMKEFEFQREFRDFSDFYFKIGRFVDSNTPPIISIPLHGGGQHMWTVVKCDETHIWYYDPSPPTEMTLGCAYQVKTKDCLNQLFYAEHGDHHEWTDVLVLIPKTETT